MAKSLYICYFGVGEPLVQTQVIPYLRELVKGGNEITLLTFEPGDVDKNAVRESLAADGIEWQWLRYHKRPSVPATMFDIVNGARLIRKLNGRKRFDIFHARSHVPMMMAAIARRMSSQKPKLLFDIRGFFPEEYVDAGVWPEGGAIYRAVKRVEKWLMEEADAFVVLTEKAREILASEIGSKSVEVIPCCVDSKRFETANQESRRQIRSELRIGDRFTIAYVGAFGGWYLTRETADFLGVLKQKMADSFALILTQSDPEMIRPLLKERGYSSSDFFIGKVISEDIPRYLSAADAAVSFIKSCYSKQASSPTKNAEYLACGLPVIANSGVGDVDAQITEDRTGVIVGDLSEKGYFKALHEVEKLIAEGDAISLRCRKSAKRRFDLEAVGGKKYCDLYRAINGNQSR